MDEEDYTKLTIENACVHKVWKARLVGYEGAAKHFQKIEDEKSSEWNKYVGLVKRFVIDNHALCQEKGLEAVLLFVENCGSAGSTTRDVVSGIIQKCLAAPKAQTRELAAQVILMYIEIEKYEIVFEELIKGTESKNPKVVAACIHVLIQAMKEFGCKIINVGKLIKYVPSLLDDRDCNVRLETKMLVGVVYHWLGAAIKPQLTAILKPVQLAEVEREYEKVKNITPKATRLLRSQQAKQNSISDGNATEEAATETEDEECGIEEKNEYDLLDPVDILSKIDENFYTKLDSKKWSERKEVLEELEKLISAAPKLEPNDYTEIVRALKKVIIKDPNVVVVGIAIKCIAGIAKGLKKKFHQYAPLILPAMFEKFKEKKQTIISSLREAVDAVYLTTNLEDIQEDTITYLDYKNPNVKSEMSAFLGRCISKSTPNVLNKKMLKSLCKALTNGLRDQDPAVRDNAALALGTAMKVVGKKAIGPFLMEIDSQILKKIHEYCDNVKISGKQPSQKEKDGPKPIPKEVKLEERNSEKTGMEEISKRPTSREESQTNKGNQYDDELVNEIVIKNDNESVKNDINNQLTDQLVAELGDKNWQVRAKAVAKLQSIVNSAQAITCNLCRAAPAIAARISDSNIKISASAIALVESLAPAMGPSFKQYIRIFFPSLVKAFGDTKPWIRSAVIPCLNTWGEVCGFKEFFEGEIIADALKTGSTTMRCELWKWLAYLLPNIPNNKIKKEELTACLPTLYSNLEDRNHDVRKNACDAVLGFMLHLGFTSMMKMCERRGETNQHNSNNQLKQILEKTRGSLPVQPMLKLKSLREYSDERNPSTIKPLPRSSSTIANTNSKETMPSSMSTTSSGMKENGSLLLQVNSLKTQRIIDEQKWKTLRWNFVVPTSDFFDVLREQMIIANIDKTLIDHMFHKDFRYHSHAIDALTEDLILNKEALISNLDLILRWLSLRFFDTNPSVLLKGLDYLNSVFRVLTENEYILMDSEASSFFPHLISKIGDSKDTVRNSVRVILKQMVAVYPVNKQFFYLMCGLKSKNARQRSECLEQLRWLIEKYGISICNPTPAGALKEIAKYINDRDSSVRNAALNCVMKAYSLEGEKTLKWVGPILGKNMSLLEEKIKRITKSPPMNIVKPLAVPTIKDQEQHKDLLQMTRSCDTQNLLISSNPSATTVSNINGAYSFDQSIINRIECTTADFQAPKLVDIDLHFLKDKTQSPPTKITSNYPQPASIIHELLYIDSNNFERAMIAVSKIDAILNSEMWQHLIEFVDLTVSQLIYSIIIINQCEQSEDVLKFFRANFLLLTKICSHPELCSKITEVTLSKILKQLLYLLTEQRLSMQGMFVTLCNNLAVKLLENSNKTNVFCALLKILYSTVNNPRATNYYNEIIVQWIQKLNKSQAEWDSELDYSRILNEFHIFLKDYPISWWKDKEVDFPLRIIKTVLYTMVNIRGTEVRQIVKRIPYVTKGSELYSYIKKIIKMVKTEGYSKNFTSIKENNLGHIQSTHKISKETKNELSRIFEMISNFEKTSQGMKRLFEFKKSHPEADIETFLSKTTSQFQHYIRQGLQEQQYLESSGGNKDSESEDVNQKECLTGEAEFLWNRLKKLQEHLFYQTDNKT